jgi:tetratricopeptide (TPR) repeat protein
VHRAASACAKEACGGLTLKLTRPTAVDAKTHNDWGVVHWSLSQFNEAVSDYSKALEINPRFALGYQNRAEAYYHLKDYDRAWKDVHKAQELGAKIQAGFLKNLREAICRIIFISPSHQIIHGFGSVA